MKTLRLLALPLSLVFIGACFHHASRGSLGNIAATALEPVELQMIEAAIDTLARPLNPRATLCLQLLGGPTGSLVPTQALLAGVMAANRTVPLNECPATYVRMIAHVDSMGRSLDPKPPAGYVEPYQLTLGRPQFDRPGNAWIYARIEQGMSGHDYLCQIASVDRPTFATCRGITQWVH